jgi:enamine deaminase RidA (YjgF/YER057c/UK114 family)
MRRRLFNWQAQRFLYLGLEGEPGVALPQQSSGLFARADAELAAFGFSLERNTVRTRVFGRSSAARAAGSAARTQALVGQARAAGSSYVSVPHFFSAADVGLDLFAMAAPSSAAPSSAAPTGATLPSEPARQVSEHVPLQSFIRHLVWGPMVFLAGMTCETQPTLRAQCADILPRAEVLLRETGCAWENVVRVSFFLHRDQDPDALLAAVAALAPVPLAHAELELVEGFSRPGKLIEIEITARR